MTTKTNLHSVDHMLTKAAVAERLFFNKTASDSERAKAKRVANLCFRRALRLESADPKQFDLYDVLP